MPTGKTSRELNPSEKAIETAILMYLNNLPDCFAWKNNTVGIFDKAKGTYRKPKGKFLINGVSDILGVYKGRMLAIEVKKPGKKMTEEQEMFVKNVDKHGGVAGMATSIEDAIEILRRAG